MENNNNERFSFTYSAQQHEEIKRIRDKYLPPDEDKMEQLRRLDRSVTQKSTAVSLALGIIGALLLGLGMSCTLVWQGKWFVPGIIVGLIGIGIAAAAYPMYTRITKRERERIAPEILRLTEELMK